MARELPKTAISGLRLNDRHQTLKVGDALNKPIYLCIPMRLVAVSCWVVKITGIQKILVFYMEF